MLEARANLQEAYDRAYKVNVNNRQAIDRITEVANQSSTMSEALSKKARLQADNEQAISSIREVIQQSKLLSKPLEVILRVRDYATRQSELIKEKLKAIKQIVVSPIVKVKDFATTQLSKVNSFIRKIGNLIIEPLVKIKDMAFKPLVKIYEKAKSVGKLVISPIIKTKDMATQTINKVKGLLDRIKATKTIQTILKAKDMASSVITKVKGLLDRFKASQSYQTILKAKDMATKVIGEVTGKLKAIAGKTYSAVVKAKDMASSVIGGIKGKLAALAGGVTIAVAAKIGVEGLGAEQNQKLTITRVIENAGMSQEDAKKATEQYYSWLEEYANKTPFETQNVTMFGTKAMMIAQGDIDRAKQLTDAMNNIKAFVGDLRTEQEVAEAMFSGANGNLEMLNNMLGTTYSTFDEALTGIQEKQGGMVEQMSRTIPGLMSTITGKLKTGLKDVTKAFEPFISGAMSGMISGIDKYLPKVIDFFNKNAEGIVNSFKSSFGKIKDIVMPVFESIKKVSSEIFKGDVASGFISNIKETFNTLGEIIGGIATNPSIQSGIIGIANGFMSAGNMIMEVFNNITSNDSFMTFVDTIGGAFSQIGEMMQNVFSDTTVIDTLSSIGISIMDMVNMALPPIMNLMDVLGPVLQPVVETIGSVFETVFPLIGQIIQDVTPVITQLIGGLKPIIDAVCEAVRFVFDAVAECWPMISEIISTAGAIISPILQIIGTLAGVIVDIFKTSWPLIKGAIEGVWNFIKPILEWVGEKLQWVADMATLVVDGFKKIPDAIEGAKEWWGETNWNPGNWFKGDKKAFGMQRVPYNNYPILAHEGEMVLTKQQASQYERVINERKPITISQNIIKDKLKITKDNFINKPLDVIKTPTPQVKESISNNVYENKNVINEKRNINIEKLADSIVVREDADIDKIANALVNKLKKVQLNYGGVY